MYICMYSMCMCMYMLYSTYMHMSMYMSEPLGSVHWHVHEIV
jgi:hypothetical protein